jgi:hypothetical protein
LETREELRDWNLKDDFVCECHEERGHRHRAFMTGDLPIILIPGEKSEIVLAQSAP